MRQSNLQQNMEILKEDQQTFWMYGRRNYTWLNKEIINHENAFVTCHTCRNRSTAACFFGRLSQSVVDWKEKKRIILDARGRYIFNLVHRLEKWFYRPGFVVADLTTPSEFSTMEGRILLGLCWCDVLVEGEEGVTTDAEFVVLSIA